MFIFDAQKIQLPFITNGIIILLTLILLNSGTQIYQHHTVKKLKQGKRQASEPPVCGTEQVI